MEFVDTHTHVYLENFDEDRDEVIARAIEKGVSRILLPNIDPSSFEALHRLSGKYPDQCFPMMGLHPTSVKQDWEDVLEKVKHLLDSRKYFAVGEIGIDLYWDKTYQKEQEQAFLTQCGWAAERSLPVSIHCRESLDLVISLLEEHSFKGLRGVFHCFTGTREQAGRIINLGFHLGIGGVLTFKNSGLKKELRGLSPEHMVLETDAPFLAPMPYRGKRNEPAYIPLIANHLADALDMDPEEVAERTTRQAKHIFKLP